MALVTAPRNGIPIGWVKVGGQRLTVEVHPEYLRYFESLVQRVGGVTGTGTDDLALSQFEDAGIEENKLALYRFSDDTLQAPPAVTLQPENHIETSIEELRAQLVELAKSVQALQQGMTA